MRCARPFLLLVIVLCAALALAQGVPPTQVFQLDGNAALSPSTGFPAYGTCTYDGTAGQTCDYWNLLNGTGLPSTVPAGQDFYTAAQVPPGSDGSHWNARTFIDGTLQTEVFTGGSKDTQNTTGWSWAGHSSPNKDTFLAGYAAAYEQNGHLVLIFGANRLAPNGDANVGIWFFQQDVEPQSNGTFGPGVHSNGDIFVVSAFTNGGGTAAVTVYAWAADPGKTGGTHCGGVKSATGTTTPGQCADTNLVFLGSSAAGSTCDGTIFCAITNGATTTTTWNGDVVSPLFFEGGVDITQAFINANLAAPSCISSFLEETRASQSTGAELKDFLGGKFTLCGISVTKSCSSASISASGATTYSFNGVVTNSGVGALYDVDVQDTYPSGATNTSLTLSQLPDSCNGGTNNCLGAGHTVNYSGSFDLSATNNTAVNKTKAVANAFEANAAPTDCTANGAVCSDLVSWTGNGAGACAPAAIAGLVLTKTCSTTVTIDSSQLLVRVDFGGTLTNKQCTDPTDPTTCTNSNVNISSIALCDSHAGVTCPSTAGTAEIDSVTWPGTAGVLGPGQSATYRGHYTTRTADSCTAVSGTAPNLTQTSGRCEFDDTMHAAGTGSDNLGTISASAAATCHLCPSGACTTGP